LLFIASVRREVCSGEEFKAFKNINVNVGNSYKNSHVSGLFHVTPITKA
jgi:hypothetical protein